MVVVMNQVPLNISFRKALVGDKMTSWNKLVAKITNTQLSNGRDIFTWDLHNDGHFSVQSMYQNSMNEGSPLTNKFIWKLKLPLKIKIVLFA